MLLAPTRERRPLHLITLTALRPSRYDSTPATSACRRHAPWSSISLGAMPAAPKPPRPESASEREMRDQEVVRANRELAAYFKGRRTEREARAALKIIKAFIRDRERQGPTNRRPLPGVRQPKAARPARPVKARKRRVPRTPAAPAAETPPPATVEPTD
jgi:hypothetical protein